MGCHRNIAIDKFPAQTDWLGKRVDVCFHYQADKKIGGQIVRDDKEEPGVMLFKLDDGRYVLATECHYSFPMGGGGE